MTIPILYNKGINRQLAENGFAVVDFLFEKQVELLYSFYLDNPNKISQTFHASHFNTDVNYKRKVHDFILYVLSDNLRKYFVFHHPIFANFMVKEAGGSNPMPLHADWTYVDEGQFSSYAVWVPLINTNESNGCIGVIPNSQHLSYNIRGPRILQWEHPADDMLIRKLGRLLPIKKGQALIYNHRTLHYSLPNNSNRIRPAINISLVPKDEQVIHYTVPEGYSEVLKFEVSDENFYLDYDNFQMPRRGKLLGSISTPIPLLNDRLEGFIKRYACTSLLSRFRKIFTQMFIDY